MTKAIIKQYLPMKEGVSPSFVWVSQGFEGDVLSFFRQYFVDIPSLIWQQRIAQGEVVRVRGELVDRVYENTSVHHGDCIYYYRSRDDEMPIPFYEKIMYQDAHLLVVDKPHFLPVLPTGRFLQESLLVRLKKQTGIEDLSPIHRLDRETAGVMLFSCQAATRGMYQTLFQQQVVHKTYHAIAPYLAHLAFPLVRESYMEEGKQSAFFVMCEYADKSDKKPNTYTHIDVLKSSTDTGNALYELKPKTGKKHQLRVHMAGLGAPIQNDQFYPKPKAWMDDDFSRPLQLLAKEIRFIDPLSQVERVFQSCQDLVWES